MGKRFYPNDYLGKYMRTGEFDTSKDVIPDYDRGMQRAVVNMITSYLLSKEAEDLKVIGFQIYKETDNKGVHIHSKFILESDEEDEEEEKFAEADRDFAEFIKGIIEETISDIKENDYEPKRKPRRKRKEE